ncbi:FMN-binding negative transcriptional regulator [Actinomyces lilanjuaniae]|uniref:FMN-binding negative transcriptional regulator n=1 Tax=Actinomyces lilanjuaniae TaxID=2321394 RepID=A0ABN5PRQ7_9ACTO|nr:FMN-binding negative transcriptional regulator [Actinomyces lilanjuaniae]AYD89762.1 FMN-binding negative transcriptional regulator [Actinomyces lilanjuaniae]
MYVPRHFELPEGYAASLLTQVRVGNLVTVHADGPAATLVPFYLDQDRDTLVTHLVRNNPQARLPALGPALVILDEADAYVAPRWYATNEVKANVPTWDYITVHVTGRVRVDPSPAAALRAARELTLRTEPQEVLDRVGEDSLERMARAIVAVEVQVEQVTGKAKMSQNRHPDDIRSLIAALEEQGQTRLVNFLREVSLPYAEERFATISSLRSRTRSAQERSQRPAAPQELPEHP